MFLEFAKSYNIKAKVIHTSHLHLQQKIRSLVLTTILKLIKSLKEKFPNSDTTDDIKITSNSKNWVMVRLSGTEHIIRIYGEAESQQKLDLYCQNIYKKLSPSFPTTLLKPILDMIGMENDP